TSRPSLRTGWSGLRWPGRIGAGFRSRSLPVSDARWLLALDTSPDWAVVALTDGEALAELNWTAGRKQTTHVMPEVERLIGTMGLKPEHLGAGRGATGPRRSLR